MNHSGDNHGLLEIDILNRTKKEKKDFQTGARQTPLAMDLSLYLFQEWMTCHSASLEVDIKSFQVQQLPFYTSWKLLVQEALCERRQRLSQTKKITNTAPSVLCEHINRADKYKKWYLFFVFNILPEKRSCSNKSKVGALFVIEMLLLILLLSHICSQVS